MKTYNIGDLLKCRELGTLWIVYGFSVLYPDKLRLRQLRNGKLYTRYDYSKSYDLVCRPHSSKTAGSEL